jgi:ribosomal protein S14
MKQRVKDRRRRQKADERWEVRLRRKAQRVDQRRISGGAGSGVCSRRISVRGASEEGQGEERIKRGEEGCSRRAVVQWMRGRVRCAGDSMVGSPTVVRNRCVVSGNGRSVRRWFRKSGRQVRELARGGKLEGVHRISW